MPSARIQKRIDRLLDEIEEAADAEDWSLVQRLSNQVLRLDPRNEDATAFLDASKRDAAAGPESTQTAAAPSTLEAPDLALPSSFVNERYEVKSFLGEGGRKKVYLTRDAVLNRDVAFALIKTEGIDQEGHERIVREAQASGQLGSHSDIVTLFDFGEQDGRPYMVTELMNGGDVERLIEESESGQVPLGKALEISKAVCRGLEFAHSNNLIHRDLKPANVMLTSDGEARIGDFGLAVAQDGSRLTAEGLVVGTVTYMSPEQAMGGDVTPKSDLYSFGAMLYEMVVGRPPFLGDDPIAVIGQHVNTPPVAPTWHNSSCPKQLEALILRLLAKDPAERPESASDVLAALEAIDLTEFEERDDASDESSLDSLASGVFVGRTRELDSLKAALEDALGGHGRLLMVAGEPGIGKTRTAAELATYAGFRKARVLWGRCYEHEGVPPYWPWVQAIRAYVRDREPAELRSEMGSGAREIAEIVSDVHERLPDLAPPPRIDAEEARFRLFDAVANFLKAAGETQTLVLVLDDLQWADRPTLLLLEFVARELGGARLLIIGTYRDVDLNRRHPLSATLGELSRSGLFDRLLLRGLDEADVGRFIELATGIKPPEGLVKSVHTQTEGNPLFLTEVIRLLVQEGEISPEKLTSRTSWTVRIPEGVRQVIGRRLDRLSERCNQTLSVAALVGRRFHFDQMAHLVEDLSDDRLLDVLDEALGARVIEEPPDTVGDYQFTHALIQETLTDELSITRKVRLHAKIGEALEDLYGDDALAHSAELAHHFSEAETVTDPEKLARYSLAAGQQALERFGWEESISHFERGINAKTDQEMDAVMAAISVGLSSAQQAVRDYEKALENAKRGVDYHINSGDAANAVAAIAGPLSMDLTVDFIDRALEMVPPDSREAGLLLSKKIMYIGLETGDYESTQVVFRRIVEISNRLEEPEIELRALWPASVVDVLHGRRQDGLSKGLRLVQLGRELDDPLEQGMGHHTAATVLLREGDLEGRPQTRGCLSEHD